AVIFLPSIIGGRSTLPTSASFSRTASSTLRPSAWCCTSRPRNMTVTCTLSLCSRNLRAWATLVPTSWSPGLGRSRPAPKVVRQVREVSHLKPELIRRLAKIGLGEEHVAGFGVFRPVPKHPEEDGSVGPTVLGLFPLPSATPDLGPA